MRDKKKTLDKNFKDLKLKKIAKKQKLQERGITLIALVVTIVILLILSGVTLNIALSDNGLFNKTKKATEEYKQAQSEEEDLILKYEYEMAQLQGEVSETETFGEYAMEKEIKEKYGQDIKIGDTVNYEPNAEGVEEVESYNGTWKVLGIENGQLLLISSKPIKNGFELKGVNGYVNGVKELDNLCSSFGNGTGAVDARSLKVRDINRITGYNPDGDDKYNKGTISEYGNVVTITNNDDGKINVSGSNGVNITFNGKTFKYIDDDRKAEVFKDSLTIINDCYEYYAKTGKYWGSDGEEPNMDRCELVEEDFLRKFDKYMVVGYLYGVLERLWTSLLL